MGIAIDYLRLIETIAKRLTVPCVQSIHIAALQENPEKSSKFGAMVLSDGTVGLTYTDLDGALSALQDRAKTDPLIQASPVQIAQLYAGQSGWQRSLGMAAINAISQVVFKRSGYIPPIADKTINHLALQDGDHVGMVGFFPPLVEQVRALGLPLTVVELDERWLQSADGFDVTLNPEHLRDCNKIVCTGTVLINQTIDALMEHCGHAEQMFIVGPTMGCLPDPLFDRGVTLLGGCSVVDSERFIELWTRQEKWRGTTRRYVLSKENGYPGYQSLLAKIV